MFDISKDNLLKDLIKFPKKNFLIIIFLLGFGEWLVSDLIKFAGGSIGFFDCLFGEEFLLFFAYSLIDSIYFSSLIISLSVLTEKPRTATVDLN